MTQDGARDLPWLNGYWPGEQAEAGSDGGRLDFLSIVGAYVTDREIRMAPGWKCVIDPTDETPGNDGYLALVTDAKRPVAAPGTSTSKLREHLTDDYNPVSATLREMKVYARPTHLWGMHRVRDRICLIGETGLRIEPILSGSTIVKVSGWSIPTAITGASVVAGSSATVLRVAFGNAFPWMVGLGIQMTSGAASGSTAVITGVTMDNGFGSTNVTLGSSLSAGPGAGDTWNLRCDIGTKKIGVYTLSPVPGSLTAGAFNQIQKGDLLWLGDVPSSQADATALSRKAHYVYDVLTGPIRLILGSTITAASTATLAVECGRTRGNRGGVGAMGAGGVPYYGASESLELLDRPSLTAFWVEDPIDVDGDPVKKVYAGYVANRQRDFGDQERDNADARTGMTRLVEGHRPLAATTTQKWGVPRRETKQAPFRGVSRVAGNRILIAIPGYGCMFQIPALVPGVSDAGAFPTRGAITGFNHHSTKPRSCGVPKAVLGVPNNALGIPVASGIASSGGFDLGAYRIAVAYRDEATGEIGELSEYWDFDNPTGRINADPETVTANGGGHTTTQTNFSTTAHGYSAAALTGFTLWMLTGVNAGVGRAITGNTTGNIQHAAFASANANGDTWEIRGNSLNIGILVEHPGYALCETMALSVMIFMSRLDEEALMHVATIQLGDDLTTYSGGTYIAGSSSSSVYGLPVTDGANAVPDAVQHFYYYLLPQILATTPTLYNTRVELPLQRTMPRGASWVAVVRGVPLSGGSLGDAGPKLELAAGVASLAYSDTSHSNQPDELSVHRGLADTEAVDTWDLVANDTIPASYAGMQVWSPSLFPHPIEMVTLDRQLNCHCLNPLLVGHSSGSAGLAETPQRRWQRWKLVENPHRWGQTRDVRTQDVFLILPRGLIQVHEPGLPSVALPRGNQYLDANKDEDSVAGGEYRGMALVFTQRHVYGMSWNQGPAGAVPVLLSSEFGCIAPNTVIEHDGGTMWIGERGICEWVGQASFPGRGIEKWFRSSEGRFLRDSQGMMRQAWAFWDENRGIAWIGLTENRSGSLAVTDEDEELDWTDASDAVRSRFPCDTVLAYNARTRTVAEFHPPEGLEILWAGPLSCSDGVQRLGFLAADKRVYVADDLFGQDNQEPLLLQTSAAGSGTTISVGASLSASEAIGQAYANRGGAGSFVRAGMDVCLFDAKHYLKGRTTAVSATSGSLVVADSLTWAAGDYLLVGGRSMTIKTAFRAPGRGELVTVSAAKILARLTSRITAGLQNSLAQPAWAKVTVVYPESQTGRHGGDASLMRRQAMHRNVLGDFIGVSGGEEIVRCARLNGGQPHVTTCSLEVELFGGAAIAVQDLTIEAG